MARTRSSYIREAVALRKAGRPLRESVALMRLANSMRPLTKAEQRRFFNAGHLRNPPRDPIYVGAFTGAGPASGPRYEDGDTCAVASPYKAGAWEVWIYGMIDPALGNGWNLAQKGLSRGAAIQRAHELLTY